jgi:acetylornithine deacetylase/succinyl-diaminopimelate desuccinylase family protein|uniref:Probable succinyl-diaminopimelate desuccinylase n=1 Tax=Candidatus Caldatribacterium californiense TaxID=1454726 RepID=A0A7V4DDR8_9BACT
MADWKALLDNEFDLFEPISLAQRLVRIMSVSRTEGEVEIARFIANYFIDNGIPVEWQEVDGKRANLIAEIQGALGEGPVLLFNGHMDTVPVGSGWTYPPLGGEIVQNRLYGRGACDMKGALAAMMYAAKMVALFAHSLYGKLKVVFVVDEEEENAGIREWMRVYRMRREVVDYAIVGEPTGLNISLGHRGVAAYRIEVRGKSCHAAVAEQGINAVYYAALIVRALEEKRKELSAFGDPDLGVPAVSVGKILGGVAPNVVPETCLLEVDVRTLPSFSLARMEEVLREVVENVREKEGAPFEYSITQCIPHLPPARISRDSELVEFLSRSIADIPGEVPTFSPFPASCEASFLVEAGIPTLIFGPGRIEEAHSANEFVPVTQVVTAGRVYALLALRLLGGE